MARFQRKYSSVLIRIIVILVIREFFIKVEFEIHKKLDLMARNTEK